MRKYKVQQLNDNIKKLEYKEKNVNQLKLNL